MSSENTIVIDGQEYPFTPGEMILHVASRNGIYIPTLCYLKGASPTGACRICLVEVEGARTLVASCVTPAAPKMVVRTETPRVIKSRRMNLDLLLSSGNHNCLVRDMDMDSWTDFQLKTMEVSEHQELCPAYGNCHLQDLAIRYQVGEGHYAPTESRYPIENINPFIARDFSRCILCGRCIQACNEVQVNNAISFGYRGSSAKVVAKGDRALKDSDCVFCGECVQACPVGAIVPIKDFSLKPSQAETGKIRTTCSYCGVGCQMYLHVREQEVIKVTGVEDVGPNYGSLCKRGRFEFDFIHDPGRLKTPLIKNNGKFEEASWDKALSLIAERFSNTMEASGPDSMGILCGQNITNEENYLAQKFARAVIGTNNIDQYGKVPHSLAVKALSEAFGLGAMTNPIEDIESSNVILITGSDTTEDHPVLSSYVKRAVSFKGAKLIVVDPDKIRMTRFADLWLKSNSGPDVAWINGMMNVIINEGLYDETYVKSRTTGFDELKKNVEKYTPEKVEMLTGIPGRQLVEAARLYGTAKAASTLYGRGITRQTAGEDSVRSLANLAMLCGNIGIKGGGLNPLCDQSNVQGACDMGVLPGFFPGYQDVDDLGVRERIKEAWGVETLPQNHGLNATDMMEGIGKGKIKALYILGENQIVEDSALDDDRHSMDKPDFLVVQDLFLTKTAQIADVVLPCASFAEKEGTFTNTERRVQLVRKGVEPPGEARQGWEVICDLAGHMGYRMSYDAARAIMQEIAELTPSYAGISYKRLEKDGIHWPCTGTDDPGTPRLHREQFASGPGVFYISG